MTVGAEEMMRAASSRVKGTRVVLDGLTLTAGHPDRHESGAFMVLTELSGWWEPTTSSGATTPRLLAHGGWDNRAFRGPRYITVKGVVWGDTLDDVERGLAAVSAAIPLDDRRPFVVYRDGRAQHVWARQEGQPVFDWAGHVAARFDIQLSAADHRKLAGDGTDAGWREVGPIGLPTKRGGLRAPFTAPFMSDATIVSGRASINIDRYAAAAPNVEIVFVGPVNRPGVRDVDTGVRMQFDVQLDTGDELVVDLRGHTVMLNGASRRGTRRGRWLTPRPGQELEFTAQTFNEDARMLIRILEASL